MLYCTVYNVTVPSIFRRFEGYVTLLMVTLRLIPVTMLQYCMICTFADVSYINEKGKDYSNLSHDFTFRKVS